MRGDSRAGDDQLLATRGHDGLDEAFVVPGIDLAEPVSRARKLLDEVKVFRALNDEEKTIWRRVCRPESTPQAK